MATLFSIQSLKPKIDTLLHLLVTSKTEICLITETWIKQDYDLNSVNAIVKNHAYKIISQERTDRPDGGIACVFKAHLNICKTPMETRTSFETLTTKLKFEPKYYILSTVYMILYSTRCLISTTTFLDELPDTFNELQWKNRIIYLTRGH